MKPDRNIPFQQGTIVSHFKRDLVDTNDQMTYLYEIIGLCFDCNYEQVRVVYKALYDNKQLYVRDYDEFYSEVDREKYPNAKQEYRFEIFKESE